MKFGLKIRPGQTYQGMLELARHAEELGLFGVFLNDHVHGLPSGREPYLESLTTIAGIGVQTKRIRIGHCVLFNSLRNPAYLAKAIATVDQMTNGRFELLIGAGWNKPEYEGYDLMEKGRGIPSARERVYRFKETIEILRGMLTNEVFSYKGKYFTLKNAINIPQPIQKPMRISVGASKPRMIRITARYADGLNITGDLTKVKETIDLLVPALENNNKKLKDFFISGSLDFSIAKNKDEYESIVKEISKQTLKSKEEIKRDAFVGTPQILLEKVYSAQELGMKVMMLNIKPFSNIEEIKERLSLFIDSVITN